MLLEYIQAAMRLAVYKILEDGSYFGKIPEFGGLWANAANLETCRHRLQATLEDWIILALRLNHKLPVLGKKNLNLGIRRKAAGKVA